jgi:hypothetical protein
LTYRVQYLSDGDDPATECWSFIPLLPGLEGAKTLAREGLADVREHLGATGFLIFDSAGALVAEEFIASSAPRIHIVS